MATPIKQWNPILIVPIIIVVLFGLGFALKQLAANPPSFGMPNQEVFPEKQLYIDGIGIATKSSDDLSIWEDALPTRAVGSPEIVAAYSNSGKTDIMDRMIQSGRIIPVRRMTRIKVLSVDKNIATVQIIDGIDANAKGYVSKYSVFELSNGNEVRVFSETPNQPVLNSRELQRP